MRAATLGRDTDAAEHKYTNNVHRNLRIMALLYIIKKRLPVHDIAQGQGSAEPPRLLVRLCEPPRRNAASFRPAIPSPRLMKRIVIPSPRPPPHQIAQVARDLGVARSWVS